MIFILWKMDGFTWPVVTCFHTFDGTVPDMSSSCWIRTLKKTARIFPVICFNDDVILGGGFKYFSFSSLPLGKCSNLTNIFSDGLKPPTSYFVRICFYITIKDGGLIC